MGVLRKLAGESAIYGMSTILGRLINYALVPLYTAIFEPDAFGVYSILYAYAAFLQILFTYGMETAYFRFANKNLDEKGIFNQVFTSLFFTSILLSSIIYFNAESIAALLGYANRIIEVRILALILALDALAAIPFARLRFKSKAWAFAIIKLLNISLNVGLNCFFYLYLPRYPELSLELGISLSSSSIAFIFISNLLASSLTLLLLSPTLFSWRPKFNSSLYKDLIKYSGPIMIMGFAGIANEMLDKILLKEWLPEDFYLNLKSDGAVGVYSAAAKLAIFMTLMIQSFRFASEPFFFKKANEEKAPEDFALVMKWFVIVGVFALIAVSLNLDLLKYLLRSEAYWQALIVVPILLLAKLFLGIYYNLSIWFKITDKTKFGIYFSFLGVGVTLIANFFLIPQIGYIGTALASLLAYMLMMISCYIVGQRYYPIPYQIGNSFFYLVLGIAIVMADFYWHPESQVAASFYHVGLMLVYLVIALVAEIKPKKNRSLLDH